MPDLALEVERQAPASGTPRRVLLASVLAVSFAGLLLELSLTRLFSVVLFYHFAFLAISVALLGLGAGGVFAFVRRRWLQRWSTRTLAARLCLMSAVAILLALQCVLRIPVSLELSRANFLSLTALYLAAAVPFFFTGLQFSVVFARESRSIAQLYGADLGGGALACLAVVPLLNWLGGPNAILVAAAAMAAAAAIWAGATALRKAACVLLLAILGLTAANYSGRLIDIVYAKGMRRDRPWVLFSQWNAISRVEVDQVGEAKYIVIDADASTAIMNADPAKWAETQSPAGGADKVGSLSAQGYNWKRDLMSAAPAVANVLRPRGEFAIIGPGGGVDVLRAVVNGSPSVTGIEINPIIVHDIMRGRFADYSYRLYERPEVKIHVSDGRSWIRASDRKFDVIQMTLVDTWASTAAGAFALSENNLYTLEAFREYFDHLKPDGMIAITRWEFARPREALRVVAQAIAALHATGLANPAQHLMVISDGALNVDGRPVTVLAKRSPFTLEEISRINQHLEENLNLRPLYLPGRCDQCAQVAGSEPFRRLIAGNDPRAFAAGYAYNVAPVSDDAPFFFFTLKTGTALKDVLEGDPRAIDWKNNLGTVVLGILLLISIAAVLTFLILPLALHAGARQQPFLPLVYFIAVGLGYITVEIALIQRFVLFLGHPTYALTVVVFLMLLSSGGGSLASRRWLVRTSGVRWVILTVVVGVGLYLWLLPAVLRSLIGAPFPAKLLASAALIVPLGFLMGMPFPTGLRGLADRAEAHPKAAPESTIEWAWAMNAASSVLGSVLAMVVAIHFGLAVTLALGGAAYLLAAALAGSWRPAAG